MKRILQALGCKKIGGLYSQRELHRMASNIQKSAKTEGFGDKISQWVSRVTAYSSQYDENSWCARQVMGSPKVYPQYGDIAGAWAMGNCDANEYLELEFPEALFVTGIDIYETYHAGGVKAIYGKDPAGSWKQMWRTQGIQVLHESRIFSPPLQALSFPVKHIRIEVDCTAANTWVEIDAVQMRGKKHRSEPPPSLDILAKDYRKLVNDKQFSDVEFIVQGEKVFAHKVILAARCDYFRAMFCDNMRECAKKCIDMPDVSYHSFLGMMHYLYCNSLPCDYVGISLTELWRVADRYSIDGLKKYASYTISTTLDPANVVDIYVDAVTKLPLIDDVRKVCMNYMSCHMDKVVTSKSFASLPQDLMLDIIQATTAKLSIKD